MFVKEVKERIQKKLALVCVNYLLTWQWGRVMHICVSEITIIGSVDGLSPGRCQAIIWTNAVILLIRALGTNFSEILSEIHTFPFTKMHLKMSSVKWRQFYLGLNVLNWNEIPTSRSCRHVKQCSLVACLFVCNQLIWGLVVIWQTTIPGSQRVVLWNSYRLFYNQKYL